MTRIRGSICIFLFLMLAGLLFCSRTEYNLISQLGLNESNDIYGDNETHFYYYSPTNPILIDSIMTNWISGSMYGSESGSYVHRFTHSMTNVTDGSVISYQEYNDYNALVGRFLFTQNLNSELVGYESVKYIPYYDSLFYAIQYTSFGRPDSIKCFSCYDNIAAKMYYDSSNRLSQAVLFQYTGTNWFPAYRYDSYYSDNSPSYNASLDFLSLPLRSLKSDILELNWICDNNVIPDSVVVSYWNGNSWQETYFNFNFYVDMDNGNPLISFIGLDDNMHDYQFGSNGLFLHSYIGNPFAWNSANATWFQITPVIDETQQTPVPAIELSAYPNPFNLNLTIKTKDSNVGDISIYNIKGQLVRSWKDVKSDELTWYGKDKFNQPVSSGVYIIKAKQGTKISTAKVLKY